MTTPVTTSPDPAPIRKTSGWWVLFQFAMLGIGIPLILAALARWLLVD